MTTIRSSSGARAELLRTADRPRLVTPPATEPLGLQELKAHLRVQHAEEDQKILDYARAAREEVEMFLRRQLVTATYKLLWNRFPRGRGAFEIPLPPTQDVTIDYVDSQGANQTLPTTVYAVDNQPEPALVRLLTDQSWPEDVSTDPNAVQMTIVAGYGAADAVPPPIPQTALQMIKITTEEFFYGDCTGKLSETVKRLGWGLRVLVR